VQWGRNLGRLSALRGLRGLPLESGENLFPAAQCICQLGPCSQYATLYCFETDTQGGSCFNLGKADEGSQNQGFTQARVDRVENPSYFCELKLRAGNLLWPGLLGMQGASFLVIQRLGPEQEMADASKPLRITNLVDSNTHQPGKYRARRIVL